MKKKNFHFRLNPARAMASILTMTLEERGQWVTQLLVDLDRDDFDTAVTPLAKEMISEATEYSKAKADAAHKRWDAKKEQNDAQHMQTDAVHMHGNASSSSSSSKILNLKPKEELSPTWDVGLDYFVANGMEEDAARKFLGKQVAKFGIQMVDEAILETTAKNPAKPQGAFISILAEKHAKELEEKKEAEYVRRMVAKASRG